MQVELKHFDVASVVKVCFVVYAVLGIVVGLIYLIVVLAFGSLLDLGTALGESPFLRVAATGFGILLVPFLAVLYGCIGAIGGFIFAVVYNLISKTLGGVKLTLKTGGTGSQADGLSNQAEMRL